MFLKYLKLIFISSIMIHASPKLYKYYGDQIEAFQKDCKTYQKLSLVSDFIKNKCEVYNDGVSRAFKYGYKLDPYVGKDNINQDKVEKYVAYLNELDNKKEDILDIIYYEMGNAIEQDNANYYAELITSNEIKIGAKDYSFMKSHEPNFDNYPTYVRYKEKIEKQEKLLYERDRETIQSFKEEEALIIQKDREAKEAREKEEERLIKEKQAIERYRKERDKLNKSLGLTKTIDQINKEKEEKRRKASSQEACLGYLQAMNKIMYEDDERIKPTELVSKAALESTKQSLIAMKQVLAYANKYNKYNCRRFLTNKKKTSTQNSYPSIIVSDCKEKWGTNYRMIKYCIDRQTEAKRSLGL